MFSSRMSPINGKTKRFKLPLCHKRLKQSIRFLDTTLNPHVEIYFNQRSTSDSVLKNMINVCPQFHAKYVVVTMDKAPNNVIVVFKSCCYQSLYLNFKISHIIDFKLTLFTQALFIVNVIYQDSVVLIVISALKRYIFLSCCVQFVLKLQAFVLAFENRV